MGKKIDKFNLRKPKTQILDEIAQNYNKHYPNDELSIYSKSSKDINSMSKADLLDEIELMATVYYKHNF